MALEARDRQTATWYSIGRAALGGAFLVAPSLARIWIGEEARRPRMRPVIRSFGARDLVLGVGSYLALNDPESKGDDVRRWLQLSAACDAADVAATVLGARRLPKAGAALAFAAAAGGAVVGFSLASRA
jgi:hypothetical protein